MRRGGKRGREGEVEEGAMLGASWSTGFFLGHGRGSCQDSPLDALAAAPQWSWRGRPGTGCKGGGTVAEGGDTISSLTLVLPSWVSAVREACPCQIPKSFLSFWSALTLSQ